MAKAVRNNKSRSNGSSTVKQADGKRDAKGGAKRAPAKRGKAAPAKARGEKKGLAKFMRDVRVELSKVTWPTRKELIQSTIVVLVAVSIAAAYTGVLDFVFQRLVTLVIPTK